MSTGSESIGGDKNRAYAAAVIVGFLTFLANVSSRRPNEREGFERR